MEAMTRIKLQDDLDRGELFGSMDRNLKLMKEAMDVDIIQRDNELVLRGRDQERAAFILREMMAILGKGESLDTQKVSYAIDMSDKGVSYADSNAGNDIICYTHKGKPLRPKTIGQKEYVDAIRHKDVVFGIGPTNALFLSVLKD